jgi:hypothetical protein
MYRTTALLPTGTKMNPQTPETAEYYNERQCYRIAQSEKGTYRIFSSSGTIDENELGAYIDAHHDQTGRYLGRFTVVGIVSTNEYTGIRFSEGDVPNRNIPFYVYK